MRDCEQCPELRLYYLVFPPNSRTPLQSGQIDFAAGEKTTQLKIDITGQWTELWVELSSNGIVVDRAKVTITRSQT
jgi:hypothetical protein